MDVLLPLGRVTVLEFEDVARTEEGDSKNLGNDLKTQVLISSLKTPQSASWFCRPVRTQEGLQRQIEDP